MTARKLPEKTKAPLPAPAGGLDPLSAANVPAQPGPNFEQQVANARRSVREATAWCEEQRARRLDPPRYACGGGGSPHPLQCDHDWDGFQDRLCQATGTLSRDFTADVVRQLTSAPKGTPQTEVVRQVNLGLAFIASYGPANELETTVLLQFHLTNRAMTRHVTSAESATNVDHLNCHGALAAKLGNLGVRQLEALAKLRGGGEQKVTVVHEHRHTYVGPGGQAIIGDVHTGGGGENRIEKQPHGAVASLAFAPGSPVWSEDPAQDAMPVPGNAREAEMQGSRRSRRRAIG